MIFSEVLSRYTFDIICHRVSLGNVVVRSALVEAAWSLRNFRATKRAFGLVVPKRAQRVGHVVQQQRPGLVEEIRSLQVRGVFMRPPG